MIDTVSERNALATKLKSIGMEVYLTILYPELKKDPNITWQEISRRYPRYNSLSVLAQQSRFSNARSIIRNGWEEDALRMIADSRAMLSATTAFSRGTFLSVRVSDSSL